MYAYIVDSSTKCFVTRQEVKGNSFCILVAKVYGFTLLTVSCRPTIQREHIVALRLQQLLH